MTDWREKARCASPDLDPDMWFSNDHHDQRNAKRICTTECPVAPQCDLLRRTNGERYGMWAGVMLKGQL